MGTWRYCCRCVSLSVSEWVSRAAHAPYDCNGIRIENRAVHRANGSKILRDSPDADDMQWYFLFHCNMIHESSVNFVSYVRLAKHGDRVPMQMHRAKSNPSDR